MAGIALSTALLALVGAAAARGAFSALSKEEASQLVGEWVIEKDSMCWFSHGLYAMELSRQFNETGKVDAQKAFEYASKPTVEGLVELIGMDALDAAGSNTGFSFENVSPDILLSSVDAATGMVAGYWQCNDRAAMDGAQDPESPLINGCVALVGYASKTADGRPMVEVTNNTPEVRGVGVLNDDGSLTLRMSNNLEAGKAVDLAYLAEASYRKSGKSADEALAYMFANNQGVFVDEETPA